VVALRTASGGGKVRLAVRNPAPELEPGDLERIFDRFVQRDGSYTRTHGGVGLGLNLVRGIVELHAGRVWAVQPEPGTIEVVVELSA
jgi:signal transduction histidine kinase